MLYKPQVLHYTKSLLNKYFFLIFKLQMLLNIHVVVNTLFSITTLINERLTNESLTNESL